MTAFGERHPGSVRDSRWNRSARPLVDGLIATATGFYQQGWMWGTSGNLSVRLSSAPLSIAVTGSGASKGQLTYADIAILPQEVRGSLRWMGPPGLRPSSETAIHHAIYEAVPGTAAVYHVHTVASTLMSLTVRAGEGPKGIVVRDLEMLKGWDVPWRDGALEAEVPVLANRADMHALADDFRELLRNGAGVPAVLVAGHGLTVWGRSPEEARNRLEIAEFVCQVLWNQRLAAGR